MPARPSRRHLPGAAAGLGKKVGGVPAYNWRGKMCGEPGAIPVSVYELKLLGMEGGDRVSLRVRCSAGTYIRSIAQELGVAMGCGAHVEQLIRTASGSFLLENAHSLEISPHESGRSPESGTASMAELVLSFRSFCGRCGGSTDPARARFRVSAFRPTQDRSMSGNRSDGSLVPLRESRYRIFIICCSFN